MCLVRFDPSFVTVRTVVSCMSKAVFPPWPITFICLFMLASYCFVDILEARFLYRVLELFIRWLQKYARPDWLFSCQDRASFSCNDRALLARCPSSMGICVKLDSGHPCYGQLTAVKKGIRGPVSPHCIASSTVQLIAVYLFKFSADQLLVVVDHRLRSTMKKAR